MNEYEKERLLQSLEKVTKIFSYNRLSELMDASKLINSSELRSIFMSLINEECVAQFHDNGELMYIKNDLGITIVIEGVNCYRSEYKNVKIALLEDDYIELQSVNSPLEYGVIKCDKIKSIKYKNIGGNLIIYVNM